MEKPHYLKYMPKFTEAIEMGEPVNKTMESFEAIINDWAELIKGQFNKGLIPLFITGSGMSPDVPDMTKILWELQSKYNAFKERLGDNELKQNMDRLFETWKEHGNKDRSIVGRILNTFQDEKSKLYPIWQQLNEWLLKEIVKAQPSPSHDVVSGLYEKVKAICLTLNFDGLLVKKMRIDGKTAFSIPNEEECEKFFLRSTRSNESLEIQARGDILYLICQRSKREGYCPEEGKRQPLWSFLPTEILKDEDKLFEAMSKCPSCGGDRVSYLSFPGSHEKEKDIQEILTIVWRHLAFRVSCVTVLGLSGWWDPLIIAFLGDLLKERNIPLLVVDIKPKDSYLVRELVRPGATNSVVLESSCNDFLMLLKPQFESYEKTSTATIHYDISTGWDDLYWSSSAGIKDSTILSEVNTPLSKFEEKLTCVMRDEYKLDKYAQLGLKSKWLGISKDSSKGSSKHHRLSHSHGVMRISSYLYSKITEKSDLKEENEKQFLRIAALLHDIGHLPFAHLIEEIFQELNWKPAGYKESFTHTLNTTKNIDEILVKNKDVEEQLSNLGYCRDDLIRLINGEFGVGYLDAIINSPIDADKIDYVFRDTFSTDTRITLSPEQFLKDIVLETLVTPERFLAFSGVSAKAGVELLETRRFLYKNLYLRPSMRFLECAVKFVIITYFVHWINLVEENILKVKEHFSDLGHYKIHACIEELKNLVKKVAEKNSRNEIELEIIAEMKDYLLKRQFLTKKIKDAIEYCFTKINTIEGEDSLKELEATITYYESRKMSENETARYRKAARDCTLRLPGAILIDVKESPKFLSIADARKKYERSDGTNTYSECIIIPRGDYRTWYRGQKATTSFLSSLTEKEEKEVTVYLYPITEDESYVNQAKNLFKKLLGEKSGREVE